MQPLFLSHSQIEKRSAAEIPGELETLAVKLSPLRCRLSLFSLLSPSLSPPCAASLSLSSPSASLSSPAPVVGVVVVV